MSTVDVRTAVESAIGVGIARLTPVHGGDVAQSYRADLDDGDRLFVKTHRAPPPNFFTTEAASLSWLREADALPVPRVVAVADDPPFLALEWIDASEAIETSRAGAHTEHELGAGLAQLHAAGAATFGREDRRTTGSRGLPNDPCPTWAEFYATQRLLPLARLASDARALPVGAIKRLEDLAGRLSAYETDEPPARLHGDLWAGNRLVDAHSRSWLIDPAAHGGHREFDLAMMRLFGGFGAEFFRAYEDAHPLAAGWQERVQLHQIAPLVVHAIKFGGGYVRSACAAIDRY